MPSPIDSRFNNYISAAAIDFMRYLEEGNQLCVLKNINFDNGVFPDYGNIHVQQYFLMRFACAYAFEYKLMYQTLFKAYPPPKTLNVFSIGCGARIDYWSLARTLDLVSPKTKVNYLGVDLYDWNYGIPARSGDTLVSKVHDAVPMLEWARYLEFDVILFPKSLSEFSDEAFDRICRAFQTKRITRDRFHLLATVRRYSASRQADVDRLERLRQAITANGFTSRDPSIQLYTSSNPEEKIFGNDIVFNPTIYGLLDELHTKCKYYQEHGKHEKDDCENRLSWSRPILYQKNMCFNILTFERNQA